LLFQPQISPLELTENFSSINIENAGEHARIHLSGVPKGITNGHLARNEDEITMTKQDFATLAASGLILVDGATGSNLILAGMPRGVCTEHWVLEHPEPLIKLQAEYAEAGSQIVYAPTFTANRLGLAAFGLENEIGRMNRELVKLSRDAVSGKALVAGDLTTTGQMMEPQGDMTYDRLLEIYKEQISYLAEAGVDLLVAETMLGVEETIAVVDAANEVCGLPIMCSLTLEADGSAMYGGNALEAVEVLQEMGADAVGVNCSVGPDQLEAIIAGMHAISRIPIIAKPNAGMPVITPEGEAHYPMNTEDFARHMEVLIHAGAGVIGGCCGTGPEYIRALAKLRNSMTKS